MAEKLSILKETAGLVAGDDIYVTRDGRLVGEDDPEAHQLVASKGRPISEKLVARYGIKATGKAAAKEEAAPAAAAEAQPAERSHKVLGEEAEATVTRRPMNVRGR